MQQAEDIATFLLDFLRKTPGQTLTGTQIAQVIRIAYKGFNPLEYGCINVRAFVNRYAAPIKEIGAAGADRIYSLNAQAVRAEQSPAHVDQSMVPHRAGSSAGFLDPAVWKTFVSPSTVFKLFANKETGAVRVVKPNESDPSQPWVQIPTLSAEFHRKLADEFAASLSPATRQEAFTQTLAKPRWWDEIQAITLQLGIGREWNSYRRRRILEKYYELLKNAGMPSPTAKESIPSSRQLPLPASSSRQPEIGGPPQVSQLRDIVIRAVGKMSDSELRALAVPLGYIADELNLR